MTFGPELSFLKDLQSVLSVGDPANGRYAIIRLDNPSIEAGFVINIPVLTLGVTFTNINLRAAVLLPFTDDVARMRFHLGTVEAPFMISAGIYGGTAHFMCEASARRIEVMEASFEFGGVGSIGFGPLQGTAYVTTGAYVRQDRNGAKFGALFSAGFTAHVACFSVTAAFVLRLIKDSGSDGVYGEGTLTFRFSVGFLHPQFRVSVHHSMGAGFRGGGREATELTGPSRVMLADASGAIRGTANLVQAAEMISTSPDAEYGWGGLCGAVRPWLGARVTAPAPGRVSLSPRAIAAGMVDAEWVRVTLSLDPDTSPGPYNLADWPVVTSAFVAAVKIRVAPYPSGPEQPPITPRLAWRAADPPTVAKIGGFWKRMMAPGNETYPPGLSPWDDLWRAIVSISVQYFPGNSIQ